MRVVYMGTPDFAVGALEEIIKNGHEVCAVVTQPDRKSGRGQELIFSPVKEAALKHNIDVLQPIKAREEEFIKVLEGYEADIFVVAAYGQLLPKSILDMPKFGCLNIHASLLPKYRGAAPIQWSIIDGEKETGVTIMQMNEGLDTGDMIMSEIVEISADETGGSLHDKLSECGAKLVVKAMEEIEAGRATFTPQPEKSPTAYAAMLNKNMGKIDWTKSAEEIERLIRGLSPWPSAFSYLNKKTLKIWKAMVVACEEPLKPGVVFDVDKSGFKVACGEGALSIESLQLEGKKRMEVADFLRGTALNNGVILGESLE